MLLAAKEINFLKIYRGVLWIFFWGGPSIDSRPAPSNHSWFFLSPSQQNPFYWGPGWGW